MSSTPLPTDPAAWKRAGQRVVAFRAAHGTRKHGRRQPLTQAALAARAGVSQGCLQAFENGTRATRRESVTRIAAAVDLTVDQLFGSDDAPAPTVAALEAGAAGHHTDEAIAIADLFTVAHTEVRTLIKQQLVDHVAHRRDYVAVALLQRLRATGVVVVTLLPGMEDPRAAGSSEPTVARGSTFRRTAGADRDPVTDVVTAVGH